MTGAAGSVEEAKGKVERFGQVSTTRIIEMGDHHYAVRVRIEKNPHTGIYRVEATCPVSIDPKTSIRKEYQEAISEGLWEKIENDFFELIPNELKRLEAEKLAALQKEGDGEKQCKVPELDSDPASPKSAQVWWNTTDKKLRACIGGSVIELSGEKALRLTKYLRKEEAEAGEGAGEAASEESTSKKELPPNPYPPVSEEYYRGLTGFEHTQVTSLDYGRTVEVGEYANLRRVALNYHLPIYDAISEKTNCRGLGLCGTCEVLISSSSQVNEPTAIEKIRGMKLKCGKRLACQTQVLGSVTYRKPK